MSIFIRIWFFFGLIILLGLLYVIHTFNQQVKPNVRQVVEDTLAENANIIAMLVAEDVHDGESIQRSSIKKFKMRSIANNANIWQHNKNEINQQIYITDAKGKVIFDSQGITSQGKIIQNGMMFI